MGRRAKDGADVSAVSVTRLDCSQCGVVEVTRWPTNERETRELIDGHVRKHNERPEPAEVPLLIADEEEEVIISGGRVWPAEFDRRPGWQEGLLALANAMSDPISSIESTPERGQENHVQR
jgi:hypothetical protein